MANLLYVGDTVVAAEKAKLTPDQLTTLLAELDSNIRSDGGTFTMNAALFMKNPKK